ncbi:MAG: excisionase, partial [Bacilli bacterium]
MVTTNDIKRPNKQERKLAEASYTSLISSIEQLKTDKVEIEIEETSEKIILPKKALNLLGEILK